MNTVVGCLLQWYDSTLNLLNQLSQREDGVECGKHACHATRHQLRADICLLPTHVVTYLFAQDEEDEEGDWKEPCSECGRRYYHEHIRTVHASNACGDTGEER